MRRRRPLLGRLQLQLERADAYDGRDFVRKRHVFSRCHRTRRDEAVERSADRRIRQRLFRLCELRLHAFERGLRRRNHVVASGARYWPPLRTAAAPRWLALRPSPVGYGPSRKRCAKRRPSPPDLRIAGHPPPPCSPAPEPTGNLPVPPLPREPSSHRSCPRATRCAIASGAVQRSPPAVARAPGRA